MGGWVGRWGVACAVSRPCACCCRQRNTTKASTGMQRNSNTLRCCCSSSSKRARAAPHLAALLVGAGQARAGHAGDVGLRCTLGLCCALRRHQLEGPAALRGALRHRHMPPPLRPAEPVATVLSRRLGCAGSGGLSAYGEVPGCYRAGWYHVLLSSSPRYQRSPLLPGWLRHMLEHPPVAAVLLRCRCGV